MASVIEQAEALLRKYADVEPPFRKKWQVNALELVVKELPRIAACKELGLRAIEDAARRKLIRENLPDQSTERHEDFGFNVWLLDRCIGDGLSTSPEHIFMRCLGCYKLRTAHQISKGPCKCGGRKLNTCVGEIHTRRALGYLASGY